MIERFCAVCGAPLQERPPTTCAGCGAEHWRNAKPCANALVIDGERVLLARRAHAPWLGSWCAPGGFCEPAEHPAHAAEREIYEETGVRARVTSLLGVWLDAYADDPDDPEAETISVTYYLAERVGDEPSAPFDEAETAEVRWFQLERLPGDLAPSGTLVQVVAAAKAALAAGPPPLRDLPDR